MLTKPRRTLAKDRLADMLEEAIDARIEELMEYCQKHRLSYQVDIQVWKVGETPPKGR